MKNVPICVYLKSDKIVLSTFPEAELITKDVFSVDIVEEEKKRIAAALAGEFPDDEILSIDLDMYRMEQYIVEIDL